MAVNFNRCKVIGFQRVGKSVDSCLPTQRGQSDDAMVQRAPQLSIRSRRSGSVVERCKVGSAYGCKLWSPTRQRHGCELCTDGARTASIRIVRTVLVSRELCTHQSHCLRVGKYRRIRRSRDNTVSTRDQRPDWLRGLRAGRQRSLHCAVATTSTSSSPASGRRYCPGRWTRPSRTPSAGWAPGNEASSATGEPDVMPACAGGDSGARRRWPPPASCAAKLPDLGGCTGDPPSNRHHAAANPSPSIRTVVHVREFDALFTTDKPVIFAYHLALIHHRLAYRRTNRKSLHVRGFRERWDHHDTV